MWAQLKNIFGKTDEVIAKYPMVLLMAFLGAVSLICFAALDFEKYESNFAFVKFAITTCLGISLLFATEMIAQRYGKRTVLELLAVAVLVLFYNLLPLHQSDFTEKYAFLIIPAFILSHLLAAFGAFLSRNREMNFWQYNKNLFINIFLTGVFTAVLTGGTELAILAVDKLFDLNFNDKYYAEVLYFLGIFGSCFIFLLFSEKGLMGLESDKSYPLVLKFFTQYVLVPLLLIYVVILYIYSFKILINWELPRGWVSYLVLAYSVVGVLAVLLVYPLKQNPAKSWVKNFLKIFYCTLPLLIVLLFVAIFTRILEYGYTEPRYFVLILAIWISTVAFYFIFIKNASIKFVPISLFAVGMFALAFPYLNAFSVSRKSQKNELEKILREHSLWNNGKINFNKKVTDTVADQIVSKFQFLAHRDEKPYLLNYVSLPQQKELAKSINQGNVWEIQRVMTRQFSDIQATKKEVLNNRLEIMTQNKIFDVRPYDYVGAGVSLMDKESVKLNNDVLKVKTDPSKAESLLLISINNQAWNLSPFIKSTLQRYNSQKGTVEVPEISTEKDMGNYHVKIIFDTISAETAAAGDGRIYIFNFWILLKKK